ncbi:hypothetical protein B0H15DRAFT_778610 [Mycena belliarum]|uniref:Zn(2)-C6 fungal-type domain-containing protein n=1 Tax=Mycena belliarum TaxID=1033014 RepID=A0AAD6UAE1_9AGAR|nr:hypothetical protein B0H15DRAFT_778610 [Mycena belliae]
MSSTQASPPSPSPASRRGSSKEISAVVIACRPCRGRKIRCDSNRPACNNCVRRKNECIYDTAPRRRGPDKRPGTRQRSCKKRPSDGPSPPQKRKRKPSPATPGAEAGALADTASLSAEPSSPMSGKKPLSHPHKRSSDVSASTPIIQPRPIQPHPRPSTSSTPLRITTDLLNDIVADLTYLHVPSAIPLFVSLLTRPRFSDTGHWLCFINLSFLLDMLWDAEERLKIQPAFILAGLAMAELMRSSDLERGASGRTRAAWYRDNAQETLKRAITRGEWIDASLAEAALILVLYESSAHPQYHPDRIANALRLLDQVLQRISVSKLDAADRDAARFAQGAVPVVPVPYRPSQAYERHCTCIPPGSPPPDPSNSWTSPLRWDPGWTAHEVRSEECRRLAWSALSLSTSFLIQCVAFDRAMPVLELSNPANYAILFPGEASDRVSPAYCSPSSPSPKESVWALYCRSLLLWNFCNKLVLRTSGVEPTSPLDDLADALQESWHEAQTIQDALEMHICNYETGVTYLCQEYIYKCAPPLPPVCSRLIHGWVQHTDDLDYQTRVIKRVKLATYHLRGPQGYQLTRRPFQVTWFLNQFSVCMQIWTHDTGLADAAELAKDLFAIVDVLNALWPCTSNQTQTDDLRKQLVQACAVVGAEPPLPAGFLSPLHQA